MKKIELFIISLIFSIPLFAQQAVNPAANDQVKEVLQFLNTIKGKKVLSGQENLATDVMKWTDIVKDKTGKYPAILGQDWSYGNKAYEKRRNIVEAASGYWKKGGLVTISWHQVNPDTWDGSINEGPFEDCQEPMTQSRFDELLQEGTDLHQKYISHIDTIANYLKMLQDSGVVVMWRPYHEMNGGWFWWGAKNDFPQLWKIMYERFTNHHKLNNLIWTWSPNITSGRENMDFDAFYPGDQYVDIVGIDGYNDLKNWDNDSDEKKDLDEIISMAGDRPSAITELGTLPDLDWLSAERPQIISFLCWWTNIEKMDDAYIQSVYEHPYTLTRDELPWFDKNAPAVFSLKNKVVAALDTAVKHYQNAISQYTDKTQYPSHTDNEGVLKTVPAKSWVSGFFPGCLWYLYEYTTDDKFKKAAIDWTAGLENQKNNTGTHDLGFMMYCSFGNGYRLTGDQNYKQILLKTAESLSSRYNPSVGCIESWDWGSWDFPVIIDNMMNLELLTWAGKNSEGDNFKNIAVEHAQTTLEHHFREDYSTFHVVDYNSTNGEVIDRGTFQGYSDESAWARGQAWALYGYTMMFRETGDSCFLNQAIHIADYFISRLPDDYVPYWDFDAPGIPDEPKDASSAAIVASALLELYQYTESKATLYLYVAEQMLTNLMTNQYTAVPGTNANFILKHSVGNKNSNSGVDVPQIYADYYYLEALLRYMQLGISSNSVQDVEINEDSGFRIIIDDLYAFFEYENNSQVSFQAESKNENLQVEISDENELKIKPLDNFNGDVQVWIIINENDNFHYEIFTVTVNPVNDPPQTPLLISPAHQIRVRNQRLLFVWEEAVDIDGDKLTYDFFLKSNQIDTIIHDLQNTKLRFDGSQVLISNQEYFWKVSANDGTALAESEWFSFKTPLFDNIVENDFVVDVKVYPNPFKEKINLRYYLKESAMVNIVVLNGDGKKVVNRKLSQSPGIKTICLDLKTPLNGGIYFLYVEIKINNKTEMFCKTVMKTS